MNRIVKCASVFTLGIFCCSLGFGQSEQPRYSRDACVKVRDGKGPEYRAFLRDVTAKIVKVRVDSGVYASYTIAQAVAPAGRSARCDYHLVAGYIGFPPELSEPGRWEADAKKAGITMSREAMIAKRNELSYLVSYDVWQGRARVGAVSKGSYARLNYYKARPGAVGDWVRLETTGWQQVAEVAAKEHGTAWRAATLAMPGGTSLPYNAMTVDIFPSWEALGKGIPARAIWNKVHPERDLSAYLEEVNSVIERPRIDVVKLIEVMGN